MNNELLLLSLKVWGNLQGATYAIAAGSPADAISSKQQALLGPLPGKALPEGPAQVKYAEQSFGMA